MPVQVSLLKLVQLENSRDLWPADFRSQVEQIEAESDDRNRWLVLADWLQESEVNEAELARAFRYIGKRPDVSVCQTSSHGQGRWAIERCDRPFQHQTFCDYTVRDLCSAVAKLAETITEYAKGLE